MRADGLLSRPIEKWLDGQLTNAFHQPDQISGGKYFRHLAKLAPFGIQARHRLAVRHFVFKVKLNTGFQIG